jgi:hypothetical protein
MKHGAFRTARRFAVRREIIHADVDQLGERLLARDATRFRAGLVVKRRPMPGAYFSASARRTNVLLRV